MTSSTFLPLSNTYGLGAGSDAHLGASSGALAGSGTGSGAGILSRFFIGNILFIKLIRI